MFSKPLSILAETIPDSLGEAYQRWKSVRTQFAHTIQDYIDACSTLDTALSRHSGQNSFEQTLICMDTDLSSLEQDYERLSRTHRILSGNRNRSKKLVPVNSLPAEILSQVFQLAARRCVHKSRDEPTAPHYVYPDTLAGVCSLWRKTAIDLPSLWSHIDLSVSKTNENDYFFCAEAWSKRANNAPLYIHILPEAEGSVDESELQKLLQFFGSLAKGVRALDMTFLHYTLHLGKRFLAYWTQHGSPGVARSPALGPVDPDETGFFTWDPPSSDISPAQTEHFFHSLQSVDLSGLYIPWESKLYHGLVRLALGSTDGARYQLTQSQLAAVFQSSPGLRELRLVSVRVVSEEWAAKEPVILKDLKALVVYSSLCDVLPLIAPGSNPLEMGVLADDDSLSAEAILSFFNRSIIETLEVGNNVENEDWFPFVLGRLEHLKTLIIAGCDFDVQDIEDFLKRSPKEKTIPWPNLKVLHLSECMLHGDIPLELLSMHSVQTLHFHNCTAIRPVTTHGREYKDVSSIKELLIGVVSDINLNDNQNLDPASGYIC